MVGDGCAGVEYERSAYRRAVVKIGTLVAHHRIRRGPCAAGGVFDAVFDGVVDGVVDGAGDSWRSASFVLLPSSFLKRASIAWFACLRACVPQWRAAFRKWGSVHRV